MALSGRSSSVSVRAESCKHFVAIELIESFPVSYALYAHLMRFVHVLVCSSMLEYVSNLNILNIRNILRMSNARH